MPQAPVESPPSEPDSESDVVPPEAPRVRNYGPNPSGAFGWRASDHEIVAQHAIGEEPGARPTEENSATQLLTITGMGLAVFIVVGFVAFHFAEARNAEEPPVFDRQMPLRGEALSARVHSQLRGFFGALSVGERLRYVSEAERIRPLMLDYYLTHSMESRSVDDVEIVSSVMRHETRHPHIFTAVLHGGGRVSMVTLRKQNNDVFIDWEAFVGYNRIDLGESILQQPEEPVEMRVVLKYSDYYNYDFGDSKEWRSYALTSPSEPGVTLYGFCRRGSPDARRLDKLTLGGARIFVRLRLQFSGEHSGRNVAEIKELLAEHWLGGDA